jgi:hypothetical protein
VLRDDKPRRGDSTVIGARRRGLRWTVGIGPGPTLLLKKSALFLPSAHPAE